MPVRSPGNADDIQMGLSVAAVNLAGAPADFGSWLVPANGTIIAIGYQVTTTIDGAVTPPVVSLDTADYDDATNRVEQAAITIPHATAAANAIVWHELNVAVTAGQHIIGEHKTAADTAGGARLFAMYRPGA